MYIQPIVEIPAGFLDSVLPRLYTKISRLSHILTIRCNYM